MVKFELKSRIETKKLIALNGKTLRGFSTEIGISHSYLSQILNDKGNPSPTVAWKISTGLNKKIEDIFFIGVVDEQPLEVVSK